MGKLSHSSWELQKRKARGKKKEFHRFKINNSSLEDNGINAGGVPIKKKKSESRLWMRFDVSGQSELLEWDRSTIIKHFSIPPRDLRILGPVFCHASSIVAREKAIVINLDFIKAIATTEEVVVSDPLGQDVLLFVDQLRQQLPLKSPSTTHESGLSDVQERRELSTSGKATIELPCELPFEFHVLEIALEVVCTYLDSSVIDLELNAYPTLDELIRNISTKSLERVRSLKSNVTHLFARVQKVRDEIEHLLDDNEDMEDMYLTRKWIQKQQIEALMETGASNTPSNCVPHLLRLASSNFQSNRSIITSTHYVDDDVEDLEMLLEAYFVQLDGIRNKILSVREYIDDTEDYVNIQLDNHRNELIQLKLILIIASFSIAIETLIVGAFGMNIPIQLYNINGIFGPIVGGTLFGCFVLFLLMLAYARWRRLLGS